MTDVDHHLKNGASRPAGSPVYLFVGQINTITLETIQQIGRELPERSMGYLIFQALDTFVIIVQIMN